MSDPLIRLLLRHALAGVLAGWTVVGVLLVLDLGHLGTLVFAAKDWPLPLFMLLTFFAITFGSVAMGAAVMSLGRADPPPGRRRTGVPSALRPVFATPRRRARIRP